MVLSVCGKTNTMLNFVNRQMRHSSRLVLSRVRLLQDQSLGQDARTTTYSKKVYDLSILYTQPIIFVACFITTIQKRQFMFLKDSSSVSIQHNQSACIALYYCNTMWNTVEHMAYIQATFLHSTWSLLNIFILFTLTGNKLKKDPI